MSNNGNMIVPVPMELFEDTGLGPAERNVYGALLRAALEPYTYAGAEWLLPVWAAAEPSPSGNPAPLTIEVKASLTMICKMAGIGDKKSVMRHLATLERTAWLEIRRTRPHTYVIHNPVYEAQRKEAEAALARVQRRKWKGEALMFEMARLFVNAEFTENARPNFLEGGDSTLEYDLYFFRERVALEFQGPQHYGPTERFPDYERRRALDELKRRLSLDNNVVLIEIARDDLVVERFLGKIRGHLPLRRIPRDHPVLLALIPGIQRYRQGDF